MLKRKGRRRHKKRIPGEEPEERGRRRKNGSHEGNGKWHVVYWAQTVHFAGTGEGQHTG